MHRIFAHFPIFDHFKGICIHSLNELSITKITSNFESPYNKITGPFRNVGAGKLSFRRRNCDNFIDFTIARIYRQDCDNVVYCCYNLFSDKLGNCTDAFWRVDEERWHTILCIYDNPKIFQIQWKYNEYYPRQSWYKYNEKYN